MTSIAPQLYARAFLDVYESASPDSRSALIKRLFSMIEKNGDRARAGHIVRSIERMMIKKHGGREVALEFARQAPTRLTEELKKKFHSSDRVTVSINPALIAGVRIVIDEERELDNSMAQKLRDMFTHTI